MTDEKQIEEMAKDFRIAHTNVIIGNRYYENVAKNFYNLNYRKIPEGAVVLTREEHSALIGEFSALQHKYEDLCDRYRLCKDANETIKQHAVMARKETAREILLFLKNKGTIHTEFDWNDYLQIDIDDLKELAKQYGVEVE